MTIHARVTRKRRINTAFVQEKDLVGGASEFPLGILGRASKKRVVNVGQRGGLTAVLVLV